MSKVFDYDLIDDYKLRYIKVSLNNEIQYKTNFTIQGVSITMLCGYNTRNKQRWVILSDRNGSILLPQTFLKYQKECELNFNAEEYNLSYFITLYPKDNTKSFPPDYDYLNWANDFNLYFIGFAQDINERMKSNLNIVLVGNN